MLRQKPRLHLAIPSLFQRHGMPATKQKGGEHLNETTFIKVVHVYCLLERTHFIRDSQGMLLGIYQPYGIGGKGKYVCAECHHMIMYSLAFPCLV